MRTAVIGMGVTGLSCLRYLAATDSLTALDTRESPPNLDAARANCPNADYRLGRAACEFDFAGIERVIVSPGLGLDHELVSRARMAGARIESDIDLFCDAAVGDVYAVTGTNGKSTVTALVGHLLAGLGRSPGVGGNLGEPALELLSTEHDCYVLELSSFQLERMRRHAFLAAVILNVTEDHLDRHGTFAAYAASKQHIFAGARRAVANRACEATLPVRDVAELVTFGLDVPEPGHWGLDADRQLIMHGTEPVVALDALPLAGLHNAQNVMAAFALIAEPGAPDQVHAELARAVAGFEGLPHRCRRIGERRGVTYIDDSKATNVGATLAALAGLGVAGRRQLVLIAGGDGKGADFTPLAEPVGKFVKGVVLLGRDAPLLADALAGTTTVVRVDDMAQAVGRAADLARAGDSVLLSPACASLDMYANYQERGRVFAAAVEALS